MGDDDDCSMTGIARVHSTGNADGPDVTSPAPKRRRIALACSACRIRKSRCNGARPRCQPCERLGFDCTYETPDTSANLIVPKDIFAALEERVKTLETVIRQHGERITLVEHDGSKKHETSPTSTHTTAAQGSVILDLENIEDVSTERSRTDGMAVSFVGEQDCGFFGPSSNIAFMRHIFRAMASRRGISGDMISSQSPPRIGLYEAGMISVSRPVSSASMRARPGETSDRIGTNLLPPDHETLRLIRAYFSNTGLLFPYIHEESFLETYELMKLNKFRTNVRRTWLGILNMVLALAVCTSVWAEDGTEYRAEQSEMFYRRARELCKTQTLRGTTLETVQYLLLTSQYLQGTQRSVQTWTTHGLAVKAALSIGLHSTDAMSKFPLIEQEMRKRTWFGCVLLDRSLSVTFGRPCAIPEDYVKLTLPTAMRCGNAALETRNDASVAFFNASILLYRIMWKIMATLYGHNLGCDIPPSETAMITQIFHLEQELNDWRSSLPEPLFLRAPSDLLVEGNIDDPTLERFRVVLTLRYFNVQLLLHRPILTRSLAGYASTPNASLHPQKSVNQMQINFNLTCVRVAEDIIEIIHLVLTKPGLGRHLTGAWWFSLYYTFNAALAIFGSLLLPAEQLADPPADMSRVDRGAQFLEKAIDALGHLNAGNRILNCCVDYLRQLLGVIQGWDSASSKTPHSTSPSKTYSLNHSSSEMIGGQGDSHQDLFPGMPVFETAATGLEDDLELGHFFASEFQRWFERCSQ